MYYAKYPESKHPHTVHLSDDEATTLRTIFFHVGGDPIRSRRRHVDELDTLLKDAGVRRTDREIDESLGSNTIYFMPSEAQPPTEFGETFNVRPRRGGKVRRAVALAPDVYRVEGYHTLNFSKSSLLYDFTVESTDDEEA